MNIGKELIPYVNSMTLFFSVCVDFKHFTMGDVLGNIAY